jgi:hypothetical protein
MLSSLAQKTQWTSPSKPLFFKFSLVRVLPVGGATLHCIKIQEVYNTTPTHPRQCLSAYNTLLQQRQQASLAQPPAKKARRQDTEPKDRVMINGKHHKVQPTPRFPGRTHHYRAAGEWRGPAEHGRSRLESVDDDVHCMLETPARVGASMSNSSPSTLTGEIHRGTISKGHALHSLGMAFKKRTPLLHRRCSVRQSQT